MIHHVEDPAGIENAYVESLNLCFPGWGGSKMFDWCFRRRAGGPPADFFVAQDQAQLIAGSATTYRLAKRPGLAPEPIGCMTATWTLRAARGRGLFPQLIEASRRQARRRGCRVLIAFAGAGKASRPGLLAAGARAIEGAFLTSAGAGPVTASARPATPEETLAAFASRSSGSDAAKLIYEPDEWRGQMIDRPWPVDLRKLDGGTIAVIERAGETDRLLDVSVSGNEPFVDATLDAAAISHGAGRRLSLYTLEPQVIAELAGRGFTQSRAWLYLMSAGDDSVDGDRWWFANGDRM